MIFFIWNCRGLSRATAIRSLRELIRSHRPDVVFLSEIKCSHSPFVTNLGKSLGFTFSHCVPAAGRASGLLLLWKAQIDLNIVVDSQFLINCLIGPCGNSLGDPWQMTFIYDPRFLRLNLISCLTSTELAKSLMGLGWWRVISMLS